MNTTDEFDRFLAQNLREAKPYIPDNGFTDQIMAQVPVRQHHRCRDWLILWLPCLIISLIVLARLPLAASISELWSWLTADLTGLIAAGASGFFVALLACFGWLAREMKLA